MPAKWTEVRYGCTALILRHGFDVNISWEDSGRHQEQGYKVCCEGIYLAQRFQDLDGAKKAAVQHARRILSEALADLPEEK